MSDMKEKYLGESKLSDQPKKKINFILGDKVVTTSKIADKSVTPEKLSNAVKEQLIDPAINAAKADLQNRIDSIQVGGLALSDSFGDSTTIGISQKALTDERDTILQAIAEAKAGGTTMLPFAGSVSSLGGYPLFYEEIEGEGNIMYIEEYNVFAIYSETADEYYLYWSETADRKANTEYNRELEDAEATYLKPENEPVFAIRPDRLFYLEVEAEDLLMKVDETLSISSTNPVTNAAISNKFNQILGYIDEASGFKKIYEISYVGDSYEDLPEGDAYHKYALDDIGILYEWNSTTGEWDAADRGAEPRDIVIYKGKIGYLYPDELEWQADTNIPENYRTMVINGILPFNTSYIVSTGYYNGEGGDLMLDLSKEKVVLRVTNGNSTTFYDKWTTNGSRLSSDSYSTENNIYVYIEEGKLHIGVVKDNAFIEMNANATITIDNALSPNSSNPVKNSALYNEFNNITNNYNNLIDIIAELGNTRLMPIDGLAIEPYDFKQQSYAGEDGEILIDEANERIVLVVEKSARSYWGYASWNNAGGRYPSSAYNLNTQFFWNIDEDNELHIGCFKNHQYKEITKGNGTIAVDSILNSQSSNPVKNSTLVHAFEEKQDVLMPGENIKTINGKSLIGSGNIEISASSARQATVIHYYGDNPQNKEGRWHRGELFYDTSNDALYECSRDYEVPDTEISLIEGFYVVVDPELKFFYYNDSIDGVLLPVIKVDSVENINSKNPLENSVIARQLQGLRDLIDFYHPKEEIPPSDEPNDPGDPNVYSNIFDSTVGNWGELNVNTTIDGEVVNLKNNVEKITPELMGAAWDKLNVDYLDEGVTLIEDIADIANLLEDEKFMITAAAAGFQSGTEDSVKTNNETVLLNILNAAAEDNIYANCVGVKLDQVYYIRGGQSSAYAKCAFYIEKDFVIDGGDSNDIAVGGFRFSGLSNNTRYYPRCFNTNHSLNLRNVLFYQERANTVNPFVTISYANFISQIQIVGCKFIGVSGVRFHGCILKFTPADLSPFEVGSDTRLISSNAIDYVLIKDNDNSESSTTTFINSAVGIRVNKGFLVIGNTFYAKGIQIAKLTGDAGVNGSELGYVSCPMFVVDNDFIGYDKIVRADGSTEYCCAINVNYQSIYVLHNNISDYISGIGKNGYSCATYDLYANSAWVYFCNNHVHNLIRFREDPTNSGTFKAKGGGIPNRFNKENGTGLFVPIARYYVGNTYDMDKAEVLQYWNNRATNATYTYADYPIIEDYDNQIVDYQGNLIEEYAFCLHMGGLLFDDCPYTRFSGNTISYPYVRSGAYISGNIVEVSNNVYSYTENGTTYPVKFVPALGSTHDNAQLFYIAAKDKIDIIGNTFNFSNPIIDLVCIRNRIYADYGISTYVGTNNINVYNNVLSNHNVLRYIKVVGENTPADDYKFKIFDNIQYPTSVEAAFVPTTESIPLSDDTNTLQPAAISANSTITVNGSVYRRTAGAYVTNMFRFKTSESTSTFENLVFNNVTYILKVTATESVTVTLNGQVDNINQLRNIFTKALLDGGYTAYNYESDKIYVISNHCGVSAWNRADPSLPINQDQSSDGKNTAKVFSISPNIVLVSYNKTSHPAMTQLSNGENAVWTKISEGDDPIPIGPTLPTVDTYEDLPLNAKVGDQVIVEGGAEAGTYECEEEGTPCTVNFAFRSKSSDSTFGVAYTFNNETFQIPFYEDVVISLTLNGSLTPEGIRDAFVTAVCNQLGHDSTNEKEIVTVYSGTYQIYYAQVTAKSNGESAWKNTGTLATDNNEYDSGKRRQLLFHSANPKVNVQSHNGHIGRYDISAGSKPTWRKID